MKILTKFLLIFIINFSSLPTTAEGFLFNSFFKLYRKIWIVELKRLNFGTIESPASTGYIKVNMQGEFGGTPEINFMDTSMISNGLIRIYGSSFLTINIKATNLNTYSFINYEGMRGSYPGIINFDLFTGQANLLPPGNGKNLTIGAKLRVNGGVASGDYEPAFKIEVFYD